MFMSRVKSPAPKAMRLTRVPADAMARMLTMPLAVSMIGIRSHRPTGKPRFFSRLAIVQSALRISSAASTFGRTMPSTPLLHDGSDVADSRTRSSWR